MSYTITLYRGTSLVGPFEAEAAARLEARSRLWAEENGLRSVVSPDHGYHADGGPEYRDLLDRAMLAEREHRARLAAERSRFDREREAEARDRA